MSSQMHVNSKRNSSDLGKCLFTTKLVLEEYLSLQIHDIVPDIMTTGKPLGNGHPLAVTITTKDISNSLGELKSMVGLQFFTVNIILF